MESHQVDLRRLLRHRCKLLVSISTVIVAVLNVITVAAPSLPPPIAASYQVCLLYDVCITFNELPVSDVRQAGQSKDSLSVVREILERQRFKLSVKMVSESEIAAGNRVVIAEDEHQRPLVLQAVNTRVLMYRYPRPPVEPTASQLKTLLDKEVLIVDGPPVVEDAIKGLLLRPKVWDFGIIEQNNGVTRASFELQNPLDRPVNIQKLSTSCGCSVVEGETGVIQPGERKSYAIDFHSQGKWGFQEIWCVISSDVGYAKFKISGFISISGPYYPTSVDLGTLIAGQDIPDQNVIFQGFTNDGSRPIIDVKGSEGINWRLEHCVNEVLGIPEDQLVLSLAKDKLAVGEIREAVTIRYRELDEVKETVIPVTGKLMKRGKKLLMFRVGDATAAALFQREFTVKGISGIVGEVQLDSAATAFRFDVVERNNKEGLRIQLSADQIAAGVHNVKVEFDAEESGGIVHYTLYFVVIVKDLSR